MAVLGSQQGDFPRTPTLRQYYQKYGSSPASSYVKIVFKPNKSPAYGLITDHDFRVNVYEDSPLHGYLTQHLEEFYEQSTALYVQVDDAEKGYWTLCSSETKTTDWEITGYGLKATELAKPVKTQTRRVKTRGSDSTPPPAA